MWHIPETPPKAPLGFFLSILLFLSPLGRFIPAPYDREVNIFNTLSQKCHTINNKTHNKKYTLVININTIMRFIYL